ncbi:MAG: hypothetical protein AAGG38_08850 [Planctomycetota bacterium]
MNDSRTSFDADPLIAETVIRLERLGYRYVMIDGQAVIHHGHRRYTGDADFTVLSMPDRIEELTATLAEIGLRPAVPEWKALAERALVLPLADSEVNFGIDLSFNNSEYLDRCFKRSVVARIGGTDVRLLGVEDLVIHKVIAQRVQDHVDAVELLSRYLDLDHGLIRSWLEQFAEVTGEPLLEFFSRWL